MSAFAIPALPSYWPIAVALLAFGAIGLRRGWVRELATLGGILFAWLIVFAFGLTIVGWVNRLGLIASFTWSGGFDAADPSLLLRALKAAPAIDPWHPEPLYFAVFALGAGLAYLGGNRLAARVTSSSEAVLGALAGGLNGYVLSYVALGYLRGSSSEGFTLLGSYGTTLVVAAVIAAVAFALMSSLRGDQLKPKRSGRASG
jgi:hypothetical protein